MKSKDIQAGVVYAYKESPASWNTEQIVFFEPLNADHLYTSDFDKTNIKPAERSTRPEKRSFYPSVGYIAAIGFNVTEASYRDALKTGICYHNRECGYRYQIITRTAVVIGPYEEVVTAEQARKDLEQRQREQDQERRRALQDRLDGYAAALARHGIKAAAKPYDHGIFIYEEDAAKLAALLAGPPGVAGVRPGP